MRHGPSYATGRCPGAGCLRRWTCGLHRRLCRVTPTFRDNLGYRRLERLPCGDFAVSFRSAVPVGDDADHHQSGTQDKARRNRQPHLNIACLDDQWIP